MANIIKQRIANLSPDSSIDDIESSINAIDKLYDNMPENNIEKISTAFDDKMNAIKTVLFERLSTNDSEESIKSILEKVKALPIYYDPKYILKIAIQHKNITLLNVIRPELEEEKTLNNFRVKKEIFTEILALHDPEFLQQAITLGIASFKGDGYHFDGNAYHLLFLTITPESSIDRILQIMKILKENDADILYSTKAVLSPLRYLQHVIRKDIQKEPIEEFIKAEMLARGVDPDAEDPYERTPIHLLAEKYEKQIPTSASNTSMWKGTLCDSLGFFQHYGECWNDSIQMAILYTDGIKELTQPFLYRETITRDYITSIPDFEKESDAVIDTALVYLHALQRRFRRHYNLEIQRRNTIRNLYSGNVLEKEVTCSPEIMKDVTILKEQMKKLSQFGQFDLSKQKNIIRNIIRHNALKTLEESAKSYKAMNTLQGVRTSKNIFALKKNEPVNPMFLEKYVSSRPGEIGASSEQVSFLTDFVLSLLKLDVTIEKVHAENGDIIEYTLETAQKAGFIVKKQYQIQEYIHNTTNAILYLVPRHATLFYQCGGKQFFYEDNTGPVPFLWKYFFNASFWSYLFPNTHESVFWKDVGFHSCELVVKMNASSTYTHGFYPIIQFTLEHDSYPFKFFSLIPGTPTILFPTQLIKSTKTYNEYQTNVPTITIRRDITTVNQEIVYSELDLLFINPKNNKITYNEYEIAPYMPSAIRTVRQRKSRRSVKKGRKTRKNH